jgi:hypothetical protein
MKKDPKDLISGFGLCEPKSDNIIRVQVVCLPSANQSSGSLVPGSRTASSRRQTRHIDNYERTSTYTFVICNFSLRVCILLIQPSGSSKKQRDETS